MHPAMATLDHIFIALDARFGRPTASYRARVRTHDEIDRSKNDDDQQYLRQSIAPLIPVAVDDPSRAHCSIGRGNYPMVTSRGINSFA